MDSGRSNIQDTDTNVTYISGSIFDSNAFCLVNPVNTVGVMGSGLALKFKQKYPSMFKTYKMHCENGALKPGILMFYRPKSITQPTILLFPTKLHWKNPSRIEYIDSGLRAFVQYYQDWKITSIAFPKLGCGLGGLNWEHEVQPVMEKYLSILDIPVEIYI